MQRPQEAAARQRKKKNVLWGLEAASCSCWLSLRPPGAIVWDFTIDLECRVKDSKHWQSSLMPDSDAAPSLHAQASSHGYVAMDSTYYSMPLTRRSHFGDSAASKKTRSSRSSSRSSSSSSTLREPGAASDHFESSCANRCQFTGSSLCMRRRIIWRMACSC